MSDPSIKTLSERFEELQSSCAVGFDPVRFAFISGLMKRLAEPRHLKNRELLAKADHYLNQYNADFSAQLVAAESIVELIKSDYSEHLENAESLLASGRFKQLERLQAKVTAEAEQVTKLAPLLELNQNLQRPINDQARQIELSFDEVLFEQEQRARSSAGDALPAKQDGSGEQLELQSMKNFRASMKHFDIDKMIARALNECPENPGPHNPQMLAVKSLMHMRELSPQYLRRFAAYIETMLWLEKNTAKLSNKVVKKT